MNIRSNIKAGRDYEGSFMDSCENVQQVTSPDQYYTQIDAVCRQKNGAMNFTSVIVPADYFGDINNCDGDLMLGYCW
jgi:hypothetical protein